MHFGKNILLTGAGFSADYGGFLSTQMWAKIFNNKELDPYPGVKNVLRKDFDFEFAYWQVMKSATYSDEAKKAMKKAIVEAYAGMDENIKNRLVNVRFHRLFEPFLPKGSDISPHFTLNQDLLMERAFKRRPLGLETLPFKEYGESIQSGKIDPLKPRLIPDEDFIEDFKNKHLSSTNPNFYVKLHGSCDWLSSDVSNSIVIGYEKAGAIAKEPLLKWYFDIFQKALNCGDARILIIGYSFRDQHINIQLAKAVKNSGLKIYILSTSHPSELKEQVNGHYKMDYNDENEEATDCQAIWDGLAGYFPYKVSEIFPIDDSRPNAQIDLLAAFR